MIQITKLLYLNCGSAASSFQLKFDRHWSCFSSFYLSYSSCPRARLLINFIVGGSEDKQKQKSGMEFLEIPFTKIEIVINYVWDYFFFPSISVRRKDWINTGMIELIILEIIYGNCYKLVNFELVFIFVP